MKKIKMSVLLASILGALFVCKTKDSNSIYNEVELNNIEALASVEYQYSGGDECTKEGSIKCYNGEYAKLIIFKLDRDTSLF